MSFGIYVATAGAVANQRELDMVAHNVANSNTPGYRAMRTSFQEVLRGAFSAKERTFVAPAESWLATNPGPIVQTGDARDVTVEGRDFFSVRNGDERLYTKNLRLRADERGRLFDAAGGRVSVVRGTRVPRPNEPFEVNADGFVVQGGRVYGRIRTYSMDKPEEMEPRGGGRYAAVELAGRVRPGRGRVLSGQIEGSNAQPVENMVRMIKLERGHQALLRVVHAYRESDDQMIRATGTRA